MPKACGEGLEYSIPWNSWDPLFPLKARLVRLPARGMYRISRQLARAPSFGPWQIPLARLGSLDPQYGSSPWDLYIGSLLCAWQATVVPSLGASPENWRA